MKGLPHSLAFLALISVSLLPFDTVADSIDISTTITTNWTVTGGGATNVVPYAHGNELSVTSTAFSNGTFLPGGSLANFDGFWTAKLTFVLPYGATNVSLVYSNLTFDDRGVLSLNGNAVGATGTGTSSGVNPGLMVFTDGGAEQNYNFSGPVATVSGTATSGFVIGGTNTLQAVINNTRNGVTATNLQTLSTADGTTFRALGAVRYTVTPPAMNVALSSGNVTVSWITNYTGFQLQTTTNLQPPVTWLPLTTTNNTYQTTITNAATFFRLTTP
jgi:hypothetical protein